MKQNKKSANNGINSDGKKPPRLTAGVGREMKTFSYVIDHDYGYAPNPQRGICTLVQCKFQGFSKKRNIVELAEVPDVIIGTGGNGNCSTGHGTLIYIMKVTKKIPFTDYLLSRRYKDRVDNHDSDAGNKYALISREFIYFGEDAIKISKLPQRYRDIEKKGPWFRFLNPSKIGTDLYAYLKKGYGGGMKGVPTCNEFEMRPTSACTRAQRLRWRGIMFSSLSNRNPRFSNMFPTNDL